MTVSIRQLLRPCKGAGAAVAAATGWPMRAFPAEKNRGRPGEDQTRVRDLIRER